MAHFSIAWGWKAALREVTICLFYHQNQEGFSDMIWMLMAIDNDKGEYSAHLFVSIKILPSYKSYTWDLVGQATSSELFSMESGLLSLAK